MTSVHTVDHVVVGLGGLGSAAVYWLGRLDPKASVIGLERFELGHDRGASHDHSRIIRYSYHTPGYVRLAQGAYDAWAAVAADAGEEIVVETGGIDLFPAKAAIGIDDYVLSLAAQGVKFEQWAADEVRARYPQFRIDDDVVALYQANTGIAPAAKGTAIHQRLATQQDAELRERQQVREIRSDGSGDLHVVTDDVVYRTGSVMLCTDGWTPDLLEPFDVRLPLLVTREQVAYYPSNTLDEFAVGRFPVWIWMDDPCFYGFPVFGDLGAVKAAEDVGGRPTTPDGRTFEADDAALRRLTAFLGRTIPGMVGTGRPRVKTCLYTLTPDRDFVLDTVPGHPGLQVALGSAHGFKFASWFGRTLAERAVLGTTPSDITPFRFDRPGLTDPTFEANYMT